MTDQRKGVKVTVVPAGHPLLRNLNLGQQQQQQVVRPQQQPQQVVVRAAAAPQQQPAVYQVRAGQQQFMVRKATTAGAAATSQQQQVMVRPQQLVVKQSQLGSEGQIRLTPQQLAAITGSANIKGQQLVIRQQQPQQQQLIIRQQQPQQQLANGQQQQQFIIKTSQVSQQARVSPVKSAVAGPGQPVVTYIKQSASSSTASSVNTVRLGSSGPSNIILNSSNLIKLGTTQSGPSFKLTPTSLPAPVSSSPVISLPTVPVSETVLLQSLSPTKVTRQPPSPVKQQVSLLQPRQAAAAAGPAAGLQLVTADGQLISAEGLHLLSPSGSVVRAESLLQGTKPAPAPASSPQKSPLKPAAPLSAQQLISSLQQPLPPPSPRPPPASAAQTPPSLPGTNTPPPSMFSSAQPLPLSLLTSSQPLPTSLLTSTSSPLSLLSSSQPLPTNLLTSAQPPSSVLLQTGCDSPPPLAIMPQVKLPTSPLKDTKDLMLTSAKECPKDLMLTKAVSPSKILPPPPSVTKAPSIQDLLPTQPLLPSQIKSLKPAAVARPLDFTAKTPKSSSSQKPPRQRKQAHKKETHRSKMQKLEHKLNVQPILSVIDKKMTNNNKLLCHDTEAEREFLESIEKESRGESLSKQMAVAEDNYYKQHKVSRYVDLNNFSEDTEESLNNDLDDSYLHSLMKKHLKRKKRKLQLLTSDLATSDTPLEVKRLLKGRGRGRPARVDRGPESAGEQLQSRRHRLWAAIVKKEVSKAGKARSCSLKEKLTHAKRLATACMRVQRLRAMESQRAMKVGLNDFVFVASFIPLINNCHSGSVLARQAVDPGDAGALAAARARGAAADQGQGEEGAGAEEAGH